MLYEYDIRSAYPFEATRLGDTSRCRYTKTTTVPKDADWGFLKGRVTVKPEVTVSPIMHWDGEHNVCPVGSWDTYLTLDEARFLYAWRIGTFDIEDGWFLTFSTNARPLENVMRRLYDCRRRGDLLARIAKAITVGIPGKFAEEHEDGTYGKYFNPFYAAMIQARTRLKVCEFIYRHKLQDNLIAIVVDSCMVDRKIDIMGSKDMGQWRLAGEGDGIILSSGYVFFGDKRPHGIGYSDILTAIKTHPGQPYYKFQGKHRQTLAESLESGARLADMGKTVKSERSVDLMMLGHDRVFAKTPRTGRQILGKHYGSTPLGM